MASAAQAVVTRQVGPPVRCEGVIRLYAGVDGTDVVALRNVDLFVPAGGRVAVYGPSGSGKSTLLSLLAGLQQPSAGRLVVGEQDLSQATARQRTQLRRTQVGMLLQGAGRNLLPYASALQNVAWARRSLSRRSRRRLPPPAEVLAAVGAHDVGTAAVRELSAGQQQLVALATAVANGPGLLLADEPTSQLDATTSARVLDGLVRLNEETGMTLVVVTHDGEVGARLGRTVTMRDGRVSTEGLAGRQLVAVDRDGTVQLPAAARRDWPAGTLLVADYQQGHLSLRPDVLP